LRVDFHTHTHYSPDSIASVDAVLRSAHSHQLGRLVITDHNSIKGALEAAKLEPDFVIVGEEIKTTYGEFLAAFVKEEIPAHLDPFKVLELLKAQDAFISVSHPMDMLRSGWPLDMLKEIAPYVDAIETANARVLKPSTNEEAVLFARERGLPATAGSDAHHPYEIGRMALDLPEFTDSQSLRKVIGQGRVVGEISPGWVHLFSVQAKLAKRLGWKYQPSKPV
jgi:predicted metal-dependent phosphoesterase TrpH